MPRVLSAAALRASYSQETGEVFLVLLTISHASLATPLRFVNNMTNIVAGGQTYVAFPFDIALPDEREDQLPRVTLTIDNVDRQIVQALRGLKTPPTVTLNVVLASTPDTVEAGPFDFTLKSGEYDALVVTGTLAFEDVLSEPYPADAFSPQWFPGIF
jgi:hypothetical protein